GVRAAPDDVFAQMDEAESLGLAQAAMADDDPEKAQAILDRYDAVADADGGDSGADGSADSGAGGSGGSGGAGGSGDDGLVGAMQDRTSRASTTFLSELTDGNEDEAEDDIGGYYTDLKFIFDSLRSRSFRLVAVFSAVMAAAFTWLYLGGLAAVRNDLERRVPAQIEGGINIITLHPVEALIFMVKFSLLLGVIA
ncbi:preprotein translocase subunit TatC, partial [Halorubrum sp. SD626R]